MVYYQPMIFLVSDHGGFAVKQRVFAWLKRTRHDVHDLGPLKRLPDDDYPIRASTLARAVQTHPGSFGIAVCRTGVGMAMAANKHRGIRALQAMTPAIAARSRRDEDTNVLSLAADWQSWPAMTTIITRWLNTPFNGQPRHRRRLRQVSRLEHGR